LSRVDADSKQLSVEGHRGLERRSQLFFRAHGTGLIAGERQSPFFHVMNERLPCLTQEEVIFPVHVHPDSMNREDGFPMFFFQNLFKSIHSNNLNDM
jgi:hypothetical protein